MPSISRTSSRPPHRFLRSARALALLVLLAACGKEDPTGPSATVGSIEITTAPPASAAAGTIVSPTPAFIVRDEQGTPIPNFPVTVTVSGGGSLASPPSRTAASGPTPVGTWTLAQQAGPNTLTITAGAKTATITVNGVAGPVAQLTITAGNGQVALAGRELPQPVVITATDQFGNPAAGRTITISVTGGGSVSATTVTTDASGMASVRWTLGKSAVAQTLVATSNGRAATASAGVQTAFDVDVRFVGTPVSEENQAVFRAAAARLMGMIVGDLQNVSTGGNFDVGEACGNSQYPVINEIIDDLIIFASVESIDGPGSILASAGPCIVRSSGTELPVIGIMRFDVADVAQLANTGALQSVVLHEMMHVLGFGRSYWEFRNLLLDADTPTVRYIGANALAGCRAAGGTTTCASSVPVENTGGAGTANSHWRESVFSTEIMTGFANPAFANGQALPLPVSLMTIGSFTDLGYVTNPAAADPYTIPGGSLFGAPSSGTRAIRIHGDEPPMAPRFRLSPGGTMTSIPSSESFTRRTP